MQLSADKCKELTIYFKKNKQSFDPVVVGGKELSKEQRAKILGVTISKAFKWNGHVYESIRKANKRLHFLVLL